MPTRCNDDGIFFRQLCEHAGVALIACESDLLIKTWNLAAVRMFGAAADRMCDTPVIGVFPQENRAAVEASVRGALETGRTSQLDIVDRDSAGRTRDLACTIAPIATDAGNRIGASICIRDITVRIALEKEIHQTRKMSSLGQLAGAIAHHFNNILGGVITSIDYALSRNDATLTTRVLQQANRGLLRASSLVDGLLAFAEGDRRGQDLSDFTEIINELVDDLEENVASKGIKIEFEMPKLPVFPIGRSQLNTVLRNLTLNAIEAMPEGGTLTLQVVPHKHEIAIRVNDTGRGLDQEALSHLFEPFWSTKGRLSPGGSEGSGLGLAMVHGIVQMMGGRINVSSQPGQGACFTVLLPIPPELESAFAEGQPAPAATGSSFGSAT